LRRIPGDGVTQDRRNILVRRHLFGGIDLGGKINRGRVLQHSQQVENVFDVALRVVEQVGRSLGASHIFHDRILPEKRHDAAHN
jgi:hypothetical protein